MSIIKVSRHEPGEFTIMATAPLEKEPRLSWKAKGLWAYLMCKPEGWQVWIGDLVKRSKDGESAVRSGLDELLALGYAKREQVKDDDGRFGPVEWTVYERPHGSFPQADSPDAEDRPLSYTHGSDINNSSAAKSAAGEPSSEQPVREEANESPLGDLGSEYKAKYPPVEAARTTRVHWLDWGGTAVRARSGILALTLRHLGWLLEAETTLYPVDDQWKGWLKGLAQMYQAGRGDWEAIKAGIVAAWARAWRYRPTHPVGFVGEIQKAWAVQEQRPSGRRLVNVRDIPDSEL